MKITAPYNFVPLSGWIFRPDWAERVSHDFPFEDGLSGVLYLEITAHTPVLIGGDIRRATKDAEGNVDFFKSAGRYAIPGSSVKGMIRNVLEIASFGKMRLVDEKRLSIRDISGPRVKEVYSDKIKDQKAGFMRLNQATAKAEIAPCEFAHISHRDMEKFAKKQPFIFTQGMSVKEKYRIWGDITSCEKGSLPLIQLDVRREETISRAINIGNGKYDGTLVFTGQISDKRPRGSENKPNKSGKYRDFVFYSPDRENRLEVDPKCLAEFRFIHADDDKQNEGSWNTFWKERFFKGEKIPVFYHLGIDGEVKPKVKSIGLAFMYKLAYDHSISETITHTNPYHHSPSLHGLEDFYDLPELLFGTVDPDGELKSLRSRVSFGLFNIDTDPHPVPQPLKYGPTILNGPKSTYFPSYVRQPKAKNNQIPANQTYTTFMDDVAEIRGWKRYPVRRSCNVQPLTKEQIGNKATQVYLHPLPKDTTFSGKVRFHNLRPVELGALGWALLWGNHNGDKYRHSLGMAKPFGFGQISIRIKATDIRENRAPRTQIPNTDINGYLTEFEKIMEQTFTAHQKHRGKPLSWRNSEQIRTLFEMANPDSPGADFELLKHMTLEVRGTNEFAAAKKDGLVLPDYLTGYPDEKDAELFPRRSIDYWKNQEEQARLDEQMEQEKKREIERRNQFPLRERSLLEVQDQSPGEPPHRAWLRALENGFWKVEEDKRYVVELIARTMKEKNEWKESSAKKNPSKDKLYQLTIKVKTYL